MKPLAGVLLLAALAASSCSSPSPEIDLPLLLVQNVSEAETSFTSNELRSHRPNGLLSGPFTLRDETRIALAPLLPSELRFEVRVPPQAVLRFGMAVLAPNLETIPTRVGFRVHVDTGSERTTVFREEIRRYQPNVWMDKEVALAGWAGRTVELIFETRPEPPDQDPSPSIELNQVVPLWASPVLDGTPPDGERARNIILVSLDCVRADHLNTYGYARETAPHIEELAREGVVFETAVASAPETLPSHMSMLTGLPPSLHGASKWTRAFDAIPYLPELLAESGYEVNGLVTGAFLSQSFGFHRGFHRYRFLDRPGATETVDAALEILRHGNRNQQFLLLHFFDAHWPYLPPRDMLGTFGPRPRDISDLMERLSQQDYRPASPEETAQFINLYDATILRIDWELARFLDELKRLELYDDALILIVGDHGEAFYEHGWWQHTFTLYEEMVRVPLVVKWPQGSLRGRVGEPVSHVDLFSTLLAHAGVRPPESHGVDVRTLAEGPEAEELERELLSESGWRSDGRLFWKVGLRSRRHKYIVSFEGAASEGWPPGELVSEELYDLVADPKERNDLAGSSPLALGPFRQKARAYVDTVHATLATRHTEGLELDEALKERLRSLGYLIY